MNEQFAHGIYNIYICIQNVRWHFVPSFSHVHLTDTLKLRVSSSSNATNFRQKKSVLKNSDWNFCKPKMPKKIVCEEVKSFGVYTKNSRKTALKMSKSSPPCKLAFACRDWWTHRTSQSMCRSLSGRNDGVSCATRQHRSNASCQPCLPQVRTLADS